MRVGMVVAGGPDLRKLMLLNEDVVDPDIEVIDLDSNNLPVRLPENKKVIIIGVCGSPNNFQKLRDMLTSEELENLNNAYRVAMEPITPVLPPLVYPLIYNKYDYQELEEPMPPLEQITDIVWRRGTYQSLMKNPQPGRYPDHPRKRLIEKLLSQVIAKRTSEFWIANNLK